MKILLYGSNGWIGSIFKNILENKNVDFICGKSRVDNKNDLIPKTVYIGNNNY